MPYTISKQGSQYVVRKRGEDGRPTGKVIGTHPSQAAARNQIAAIYSNEKKSAKAKARKAGSPEAQRLAGVLLNACNNLPVNGPADPRANDAYQKIRAGCRQYEGFLRKVAAGQDAGAADAQAMSIARRLTFMAQAVAEASAPGNREHAARAATVAIIARQLANALRTGKSAKPVRKQRTLKAWSKLDVSRMNVIQLKREIDGLRAIQKAARTAINQLNSINQNMAKANQMLPEDNALGEAMHEINLAIAMLGKERNLTPIIREAEHWYEEKQGTEQGLQQLQQQQRQPQQQKPRGGLFGLFGRR